MRITSMCPGSCPITLSGFCFGISQEQSTFGKAVLSRPVTVCYEGVGDEPVDIQTGKFGNNFTLRQISTATSIYGNLN